MGKTKKLGKEPAFPSIEVMLDEVDGTTKDYTEHRGISKRLYIATMAMQGILSAMASRPNMSIEEDVKLAFVYADEVLKQEEE